MANEKYVGTSFESFLEEEEMLESCTAVALKRVIAWQIAEAMKQHSITKTDLARRMKTSRASVNRLLDPTNPSISLITMEKAAHALGKRLEIQLA